MREENKKFSVAKLLLTILCTVMVSIFIGSTILFIRIVPTWVQLEATVALDKDSDKLIQLGKSYEDDLEQIEELINDEKDLYGEDYPAEGIYLFELISAFSTIQIVEIYLTSFLLGLVVGTVIYIVAIQNAKGKKLIIELIVAFAVLLGIIILFNLGYEALINILIDSKSNDFKYYTSIYDLENENIVIPYIIAIAVIYVVNMIYQKRITNKLNKELKK